MFDVFIGKAFATRTLGEAHALAEGSVICFAVGGVEMLDGCTAGDTDGHTLQWKWRLIETKIIKRCLWLLGECFLSVVNVKSHDSILGPRILGASCFRRRVRTGLYIASCTARMESRFIPRLPVMIDVPLSTQRNAFPRSKLGLDPGPRRGQWRYPRQC